MDGRGPDDKPPAPPAGVISDAPCPHRSREPSAAVIAMLERETGATIEFQNATDHAAVIEGMRAGQIDNALPFSYVPDRTGRVRLFGHDPASAAEIAALADRGGAVAEFPTTVEAAVAARERGMPVVMGAPNALRGGSHSGNASARRPWARHRARIGPPALRAARRLVPARGRRRHDAARGRRAGDGGPCCGQAIDGGVSRGTARRPGSPGRPGVPGEHWRAVRPGRRRGRRRRVLARGCTWWRG